MKYINREIEEKINKFIERREIIGIRGPRQAGKTTLLKNIYEKINENKVYIDMYIDEYRKNFEENYIDFIKRYKDEKKLFLFLDEIQKLKDG
ncbi:MAG: AAA family ATPase, partial [Nanoarchaeota archaeon]|nr:AAA family ATPase [Nanoarchaeota archaeon]